MSDLNNYQKYLGFDGVMKAIERASESIGKVATPSGVTLFRSPAAGRRKYLAEVISGEAEIDQSDTLAEYLWIKGNADIEFSIVADYALNRSEEERQAAREKMLFALLREIDGSVSVRIQGQAFVVGKMHAATFVISIGQALCKQVVVGTRKVKKPADPVAAKKIMDAIEQVEVEEPILQWQCNDAELEAGIL